MLRDKLGKGLSKLNTALKPVKYISPFYYGKKGLNKASSRVFGKELSEMTDEYLIVYLAYKSLRVVYSSVRRNGLEGLFKLTTLKYIGAIILFNAAVIWAKGAYGRYKHTMKYNDVTGQFRVDSDPLGRMSETPASKEFTSTDMLPVTLHEYTPKIPDSMKHQFNNAWVWLALRLDIMLTRVEAYIKPDSIEPKTTPKPLREEWGMEDPDEVDYPLLDQTK